jgi:hypothetical protein
MALWADLVIFKAVVSAFGAEHGGTSRRLSLGNHLILRFLLFYPLSNLRDIPKKKVKFK